MPNPFRHRAHIERHARLADPANPAHVQLRAVKVLIRELSQPDPRYIVDLIKRVTTVSVETMKIVDGLPPLREAE